MQNITISILCNKILEADGYYCCLKSITNQDHKPSFHQVVDLNYLKMESSGSEKLFGKVTKWSWEIPLSPAMTLLLQILPLEKLARGGSRPMQLRPWPKAPI